MGKQTAQAKEVYTAVVDRGIIENKERWIKFAYTIYRLFSFLSTFARSYKSNVVGLNNSRRFS